MATDALEKPSTVNTSSQDVLEPGSSDADYVYAAIKDITFGSVAGMVGKMIEYPFDTVKVRLQSQSDHSSYRYSGPIDCFRKSVRRDGAFSLYRGLSAPLLGAAVENSSLFLSYRVAQNTLRLFCGTESLSLTALASCGAISGAFTSLLLTPIELVKCKMQLPGRHSLESKPSIINLAVTIYRHHGILGFWHGQLGTLIRETGGSAAWFGSYEGMKAIFRSSQGEKRDYSIRELLFAGAVAGMTYNFICYPADTIKSRMQTEEVGPGSNSKQRFWRVAKTTWVQQGVKGLYRGCGITVGRAAPSSALIFTIYEALCNQFK